MTNDGRKQLDAKLKELAIAAQQYTYFSKEKQIELTRLINAIWQSGKLARPYKGQFHLIYEDIYDEAVQNLFFYLCQDKNIHKYDPERGEVIAWVNMLLTKRFFPEAIPKIIGKENEINLDNSQWENIPSSEPISLFEQIREYIESDPEIIFRKEHIRGHPEANFQAIAQRRCSGIAWKDISAEWGIGLTSLHVFYQRSLKKFADKFQEYLDN
ncbi:sigma-70 family RNA polymerase sigma factor [Nostoc sp. CCY0012]|uniref:sigma-70 family RNA polymerase sigma factor n=1 Tax=Nostoc sp. CCY0012 TaxID=1056123 RepID=UPI0039C5B617